MSKKQRLIEGGQSLFEDLGNGMAATTIVAPIKLVSASFDEEDGYMLVIEDALGYEHYWFHDGTYDGWGALLT